MDGPSLQSEHPAASGLTPEITVKNIRPLSAVRFVLLLASAVLISPAHAQSAPRRIEISASRFQFAPAELTLKKGEAVVLVLKSADVAHGLRFKDLNVNIKADKGKTAEVTVTPEKTGNFAGKCSVFCGAGHGEMTLILHVVE